MITGYPEPLIEWLHNGERIIGDSRLNISFVTGQASLTIRNINKQDAGEYCCKASNSAGSETSKAELIIKKSATGTDDAGGEPLTNGDLTAKETAKQPEAANQTILNGDVTNNMCGKTLEKDGQFRIIRHLGGVQVASGSTAIFSVLSSGAVDEVSPDDHGIYQINFRHGGKTFTSAASLVVLDKQNEPAVCKLPQSVTVKSSTPCKLVLEMENAEDLTVQWFKGLSKVEKSNRIKSVKSGNAFKLDFKGVQPDDEGVYVVKVIKDKKAICKYAAALLVEK
ncbi:hypothetical protein WUBG_06102 [Wuchereria bancrofti]|uniref:Ig-like domain-containing protein n=1 Tax=Wuchereria bancrofti TaxID=6293 RepID=J9ELB4_WUCBA|nr:hypothetical protein WUBG_06102 [Wuchereria bancrofti]